MKQVKKILVNALGIVDSGGITVFEKLIQELSYDINHYYIICNDSIEIERIINNYKKFSNLKMMTIQNKGFLYRLYYENIIFRKIISENKIILVYNFSGSSQFFFKIPQLTKIHNLLFYSKKLDNVYFHKKEYLKWIKQIFLKRMIFKFMLNHVDYLEIQSLHVKDHLSKYINIDKKTFYLKSDISVGIEQFHIPKQYNLVKKWNFLYIVGPHFEYVHKNFKDFSDVMLELKKRNINFEINITLSEEQLYGSKLWHKELCVLTNCLGYISNKDKFNTLFTDNTILISTSIIETLGLHVIESIKNGILPIVPDEEYSNAVYGKNITNYKLFNYKSLLNAILNIINNEIDCNKNILTLQDDLKINETTKYLSILDIFKKVNDVQK